MKRFLTLCALLLAPVLWTAPGLAFVWPWAEVDGFLPDFTALALDGADRPRALYHFPTLHFAQCDGGCSDGTGWSATALPYSTLHLAVHGTHGALAVLESGEPRIAYAYNDADNVAQIAYAYCDTGCTDPAGWTEVTIDRNPDALGLSAAIALDGSGRVFVLYSWVYDSPTVPGYSVLEEKVAFCNGGCDDWTNWTSVLLYTEQVPPHPFGLVGVTYMNVSLKAHEVSSSQTALRALVERIDMGNVPPPVVPVTIQTLYASCDGTCWNQASWNLATLPIGTSGGTSGTSSTPSRLALDDNGLARFAGRVFTSLTDQHLKYFECQDSACATVDSVVIETELNTNPSSFSSPAIAVSATGAPVIAHYSSSQQALLYYSCSGLTCLSPASWTSEVVVSDPVGPDTTNPSLALTGTSEPRILYANGSTGKLEYFTGDPVTPPGWGVANTVAAASAASRGTGQASKGMNAALFLGLPMGLVMAWKGLGRLPVPRGRDAADRTA